MARPSKTEQEMGYLRDWWTEVRTMEADYHGQVSMFVSATQRPGVMQYRMVFTPLMGDLENGLGVQAIDFVYPNVELSSYAGFMWRKAISLSRMVEQAAELRARQSKNGSSGQ
jgi:hypothetical protein